MISPALIPDLSAGLFSPTLATRAPSGFLSSTASNQGKGSLDYSAIIKLIEESS